MTVDIEFQVDEMDKISAELKTKQKEAEIIEKNIQNVSGRNDANAVIPFS